MNKKIIGTIICIFLLSISSIPAMNIPVDAPSKDQTLEYLDQYLELADENITLGDKFFITMGPVNNLFSNVEIHNGSDGEIDAIQRNLDRGLFRLSIFLPFIFVVVTNMTFTVHYKRTVTNESRFSYYSLSADMIYDNETGEPVNVTNQTITYNTFHSVKVENMYGLFVFYRARLYNRQFPIGQRLFHPARFAFIGFCENVTYLPLSL